jgi:hypothetical protein
LQNPVLELQRLLGKKALEEPRSFPNTPRGKKPRLPPSPRERPKKRIGGPTLPDNELVADIKARRDANLQAGSPA